MQPGRFCEISTGQRLQQARCPPSQIHNNHASREYKTPVQSLIRSPDFGRRSRLLRLIRASRCHFDGHIWVNPEGPSRGLFPTTNLVLGHHPLGGGDYAKSAAIFYSPLLSKIAGKIRADAYYIDPADGRPKIGYFVHSLPGQSTAQVPPRNPVIYKNQLIANTSVLNWGRTPLYSDFHGITATDYGFQGTEFLVLHLDGAVSVLNRKVAEKLRLTDEGQFYYYLATGEEP